MRLNGFNQHLAWFAAGTKDRPSVAVSTRPAVVEAAAAGSVADRTESDAAWWRLSQRIAGRVAEQWDATTDL